MRDARHGETVATGPAVPAPSATGELDIGMPHVPAPDLASAAPAAGDPAAVEIRLAGELAIVHDNRCLAHGLAGAQARAAFAILALEGAQGVTRDRLAHALWPNELPRTWDSALRTAVSRARAFAAEAFPHAPDLVTYEGGRYVLRFPCAATVDVVAAEANLAEARTQLAQGNAAAAFGLAHDAAACSRRPFLSGVSGDWVEARRERLEVTLVHALETMSQAAVALGDTDQARVAADEAVARAPLRESAHRCRMAALAAAGNRAEALRAYQQLRHVLVDELGVDPSPETESAYLDLLGPPAPPAAGTGSGSGARRGADAPGAGSTASVFVGREAELSAVAEMWEQATAGSRELVVVTGEAGIGKTHLAREVARRVSASGGLVLFGRCDDEAIVPYQPFVEALDPLAAAIPANELPRLSEDTWRQLATILPSLNGPPAHTGPDDAPLGRARLFDAVTDLIAAIAAERRMLLVLDDLHWADTDTLLLLRHLLRHAGRVPILVLATMRNHDLAQRHALRDVIRTLDRDGWVRRMPLGGLELSDVRSLVTLLRHGADDETSPDELADRLLAETAGNPFLVAQLLQSDEPERHIPESVHHLVSSRLSRLDAPAVELVRAGAVGGSEFSLDIAAAAAGLDDATALDALDAVLDAGVLTEDAPDCYRFVHDIVRRTITAQLSGARRQLLHRALADAIERLRPGDMATYASVIAHHRAPASPPEGDARAVHWARIAARRAEAANAPAEAVRLYRQALEHTPASDPDLRAEVLVDLGVVLLRCDEPAGQDTIVEGATLARQHNRFDVVARAALALAGKVRHDSDARWTALSLLEAALKAPTVAAVPERREPPWPRPSPAGLRPPRPAPQPAGPGPAASRPDGEEDEEGDAGSAAGEGMDVVRARLWAGVVELGAGTSAAPPTKAVRALQQAVYEATGPDRLRERFELARELDTLAAATQDAAGTATAAHARAVVGATCGDPGTVAEALTVVARAATDGDRWLRALTIERWATEAALQGHFVEAASYVDRAIQCHDAVASGPQAHRPELVAERHGIVLAWLRGVLANWETPVIDLAALALVETEKGNRAQARSLLEDIISGRRPLPAGDAWLHAAGVAALAVAELGDADLAAAMRSSLSPYSELVCGVGYRTFVGAVSYHLGSLSAVLGERADAERYLMAALQRHITLSARPWVALTKCKLASALEARQAASDSDWVAALRGEAASVASNLGMRTLV